MGAPAALDDLPIATDPAFVTRFYLRLRDQGTNVAPALDWLQQRLAAAGLGSPDEVLRLEHRQQTGHAGSHRHTRSPACAASRAMDWPAFVESLSVTERALRSDPAASTR